MSVYFLVSTILIFYYLNFLFSVRLFSSVGLFFQSDLFPGSDNADRAEQSREETLFAVAEVLDLVHHDGD